MSVINLGKRTLAPGKYVVTVTRTLSMTVNTPTAFEEANLAILALGLGVLKTLTIEQNDGDPT